MEGSCKPDPGTPGQGTRSTTPGPRLSHPPEKLQSQTDCFLTAARLVRGGWTAEGRNTGGRASSIRRPSLSKSDRIHDPKHEISLKEPRAVRSPAVKSTQKTAEDAETSSETRAVEERQTFKGAFSAERQTGIILFRASGCRSKCRPSRRFKAPILPVIAEM